MCFFTERCDLGNFILKYSCFSASGIVSTIFFYHREQFLLISTNNSFIFVPFKFNLILFCCSDRTLIDCTCGHVYILGKHQLYPEKQNYNGCRPYSKAASLLAYLKCRSCHKPFHQHSLVDPILSYSEFQMLNSFCNT